MNLPWKALSRGLALERGINNVGPMAVSAVKALEARGLRVVTEFGRFPIQASRALAVDGNHVVVAHGRGRTGLALKPGPVGGAGRQLRLQHLQGYQAVQLLVVQPLGP
jgi:hypothetical protein